MPTRWSGVVSARSEPATPALVAGSEQDFGRLQNSKGLKTVVNDSDFIQRVRMAIMRLHNCTATWRESIRVHEIILGETLWDSDVEVFDLKGHPQAKRAYAWSHPEVEGIRGERLVVVPEIPPVDSPQAAVQVSIVNDIKAGRI